VTATRAPHIASSAPDTGNRAFWSLVVVSVLASTGLAAALTDAELAAVLAHEREHLRGRDPLKNVLARAIPARSAAGGPAAIGGTAAGVAVLAAGVAWSAVIVAHYMPMCVRW
jgi:Zn-dependent protease with chaperone function